MAIIYVTSNASSGSGTLREAISLANDGDEIRFSEDVFERGTPIEIQLAAPLTVNKRITLIADPFRVVVRGSVAVRMTDATFFGFDFRSDYPGGSGRCVEIINGLDGANFVRCGFFSSSSVQYGSAILIEGSDSKATFESCFILSRGVPSTSYLNIIHVVGKADVKLKSSTVAGLGNARAIWGSANLLAATFSDCVLQFGVEYFVGSKNAVPSASERVSAASVGFVALPVLDETTGEYNSPTEWNYSLRDDSPYVDAGTVPSSDILNDADAPENFDFEGNWRGRIVDGNLTRSPGAFETIQADLFWIGKDATGNDVANPRWNNASGWATNRFANVSDATKAPSAGQTFFIKDVNINGYIPTQNSNSSTLIVSGECKSSLEVNFDKLNVSLGLNSQLILKTLNGSNYNYSGKIDSGDIKLAPQSILNGRIDLLRDGTVNIIASKSSVVDLCNAKNYVSPEPFYNTLNVFNSNNTRLNGDYHCKNFSAVYESRYELGAYNIKVEPKTTIKTERFVYGGASDQGKEDGYFERHIPVTLYGTAQATINDSFDPGVFANDVSFILESDTATIQLGGQKVYGEVLNDATINGTGYVLAKSVSGEITCGEDVVQLIDEGANVSKFKATAINSSESQLEWTADDLEKGVLIERYDNEQSRWDTIALNATGGNVVSIETKQGLYRYRLWDGVDFYYDESYLPDLSYFVYSTTEAFMNEEEKGVGMRNDNVLFLTQIKNNITGEYLDRDSVEGIVADVYKTKYNQWEPVENQIGITVPITTLTENEPVVVESVWTADDIGANFAWTPDNETRPFFPDAGDYVIQVKFLLKNNNVTVVTFNKSIQ